MAWPPATTGAKVNNGGKLQFKGFNWEIKDSGGGMVGPGPNVFVGSADYVWTDNWGMHMNVRPRNGCGAWASSELTLDHSLGYGTYFFSTVSPVEYLDPQVVIGMFLWDDNGGEGIGYREVDFEYARWGNQGDPTSSQFVLEPLRPGNLPGWKVRFFTRQARMFGGDKGNEGGGGCNDDTADQFNGGKVNRISCALNWAPGVLKWYCWDGLYTLATVASAQGRLLGSYVYPAAQFVPPPGTERWHFNVWTSNAGAPQWGRRVHAVVVDFEFTQNQVDFGAMGFPTNQGLGRLLLEGPQLGSGASKSSNDWGDTDASSAKGFIGSKADTFRAAVRRLSQQAAAAATTPAGSGPAYDHVSVPTAVGIAVGASTLTAFLAVGVALVLSRTGFSTFGSKNSTGEGFIGLQEQPAGEPSQETHAAAAARGTGRRQQHERVAPVGVM